MKNVIFIDSEKRRFTETGVRDLEDMLKLVGGLIERAYTTPCGHEIYVNEDGLWGAQFFFFPQGAHQPFAGNGFIVGPVNKKGETTDCTMTLEDAQGLIRFMNPLEVRMWARIHGQGVE